LLELELDEYELELELFELELDELELSSTVGFINLAFKKPVSGSLI